MSHERSASYDIPFVCFFLATMFSHDLGIGGTRCNSNAGRCPTCLVAGGQYVGVSVTEGTTAYVDKIFLLLETSDEEHLTS